MDDKLKPKLTKQDIQRIRNKAEHLLYANKENINKTVVSRAGGYDVAWSISSNVSKALEIVNGRSVVDVCDYFLQNFNWEDDKE